MARKPKSSNSPVELPVGKYFIKSDCPWGGFINIKVSDEQKPLFESWWLEHRTGVWSAIDDLLGEGMKVSLGYDADNSSYVCSFTGRGWETSGSRWCMTSRAGTLDEVIALAVWKHFVLADGDWGDFRPDGTKKSYWG